ncbi:MAG: hypothetical protein PHI12_14960, partial [Dehalococcoidales bacterium]|nr:hypothetical protein [Dehalococcoidales bacterium]
QSSYVDEVMEGGSLITIGDWSYDSDNDELVLPIYTNVNSRTYTLYAEVFGRQISVWDSWTIGDEISEAFPGLTPAKGMMNFPTVLWSTGISIQASYNAASIFSCGVSSGYSAQMPLQIGMKISRVGAGGGVGLEAVYGWLNDGTLRLLLMDSGGSYGGAWSTDQGGTPYTFLGSIGNQPGKWIQAILFSVKGGATGLVKIWNAFVTGWQT